MPRKVFHVRVDEKLRLELKQLANQKGKMMYAVVEEAMRLWIEENKKSEKKTTKKDG